jgi:hypothetical protein
MLKRIREWLKAREIREREDAFHRGYNFAAGVLLRGELSPIELDFMQSDYDVDSYDVGVNEAIDRVCSLGICTDNRIKR